MAPLLFLLAWVVAAAVWAKSYADVGDGFSAGAVAGLGAIIQYVCLEHDRAAAVVGARWGFAMLYGGLVVVLVVLIAPVFVGVAPVTHWPPPGHAVVRIGVLELHSALAFDLGVVFVVYGGVVCAFDRLFPHLHRRLR